MLHIRVSASIQMKTEVIKQERMLWAKLRLLINMGNKRFLYMMNKCNSCAAAHRSAHTCRVTVLKLGVFWTAEQLKGPLEEYVNKRYPGLVKIVRNQKREGLIRARIEGWKVATAEVTGFFDAHVEFTPSW